MKNFSAHMSKKPRGYIALMATILISLVLLVMVGQESFSGWFARFVVLGTEAKEQASSLAEGCANQALAALVTNVSFPGGVTTTIPVDDNTVGSCYIAPIQLNVPLVGQVTIKTQAVVRGSFANLDTVQSLNSIHVGVAAQPQYGTLVVQTIVNNNGTTKTPADFTMHVAGVSPSKTSFGGSATGVVVTLSPGAYSTTENTVSGFAQSVSSGCSGTIARGDVKTCTITNTAVTTTLTLIAGVVNDNSGTSKPADFPLKIDGTTATLGQTYTVIPGLHIASATILGGYAASAWGYDCGTSGTVTVNQGEHKLCMINFDDNPPPTTSCADTVVMFDRSGSMSGPNTTINTDLYNEKFAGNSLLDLYSKVAPIPQVSFGSAGGLDGSAASIPTAGQLSNIFGTNGGSGSVVRAPSAVSGNYDQWTANTGIKTDAVSTNDAATTYISAGTNGNAQTFLVPGAAVPAGATISSVVLSVVAAENGGNATLALRVEKGAGTANRSDGTSQNLTTSYATYTRTMTTNPLTGAAWTLSEVNSWTTRFGVVRTNAGSAVPRVTQLVVTINYSTPTTGLYGTINTITGSNSSVGTNLNASIATGVAELNSARHKTGFKQVLILVSDGDPNQPSGTVTTQNLTPVATGNYAGWTANIGTPDSAAATNDGDTSYISVSSADQTFTFPNAGIPANATVTAVTLSAVARAGTSGASMQLMAEEGAGSGLQAFNTTSNLTNSYTTYTWAMNANPISGAVWSVADVNNWITKFGISSTGTGIPRVTQLALTVTYIINGISNTLAPTAVSGTYDQWTANGSSNKVVDLAANDTVNYISTNTNGNAETFSVAGAGVPVGATINSVTVSAVALESGGNASISLRAERGSGVANRSDGTSQNLTTSYATYTRTMTTNPLTGAAWTLNEVNSWTTRFGVVRTNAGSAVPRVTQLYVVVDYTTNGTSGTLVPQSVGAFNTWIPNTGTMPAAVTTSDADTTYISYTANTTPQQTFVLQNAGVPASAVISSVTLYVEAEEVGGNASIQFMTEKGTGAGQQSLSPVINLTAGYATYSYTMIKNPFTNIAWTAADVNNWGEKFGVMKSNTSGGVPRVTQMYATVTYPSDPYSAASAAATAAKASGVEVFTVRYSNTINQPAIDLMKSMATNASDYFASPTTAAGIGAIFNTIAAQVCPAVNNPSPPPPPTTATLLVIVHTQNNDTGTSTTPDFVIRVSGDNPSSAQFAGDELGTSIILNPGAYSVTEDARWGYTQAPAASCSSDNSTQLVAGEMRVCVINNDDIPPAPPPPDLTITPGTFQEVPTSSP